MVVVEGCWHPEDRGQNAVKCPMVHNPHNKVTWPQMSIVSKQVERPCFTWWVKDDKSLRPASVQPNPSPLLLFQGLRSLGPPLPSTFRVLVVLSDVLTAVTAHTFGADAVADILSVGVGQLHCPILAALPDHT